MATSPAMVKGDIVARRKITLQKTARVTGDLRTPGIVIEEGAKLEGRIVIGADAPEAPRAEKPARAAAPATRKASPSPTPPPPTA